MKTKDKTLINDSHIDFNQCFMLGSYDQIDNAFKFFCSESSKSFVQLKNPKQETQSSIQSQPKTVSKCQSEQPTQRSFQSIVLQKMQAHRNVKNQKSKANTQQKITSQFMEDKIKYFISNYFQKRKQQKSDQTDMDEISFMTKKYGDFLSQSLIDALILQTIKHQFAQDSNLIDLKGTTQKLLKQFNIQIEHLAQLKSPLEKKTYIMKKFDETINDLLKDWKNKIVQKERKINKQDALLLKNITQKQESDNDVFEWLNLKTKYDKLKRKLRVQVMDQLNEYENEMKLFEALKKKKSGVFSKKRDSVELTGIKQLYTSEIIKHINLNEKILQQNRKKQLKNQDQTLDEKTQKEITWNDDLEQKFQKERKNAKFKYFQILSSSNFNQLACYPFLQEVRLEDPTDVQRELKLAKYQNGDWLTAQEMKFLANTSKLLNSCVDKEQVRKTVQMISPTSIDQLEANLSEEIIENYESLVNQIQKARIEYIRNKIQKQKKEILKLAEEETKKQSQKAVAIENKKKLRQYQVVCNHYFSNPSIKDQIKNNVYADMFVRKIMEKLQDYRDRHPGSQRNQENQINNPGKSRQEQEKKLKRLSNYRIFSSSPVKPMFHPSSKLSLFKKANKHEEEDLISNKELISRKEKFSKIQEIHQQKLINNNSTDQLSFVKFYSNGPNIPKRREPIYNRQTNQFSSLTQEELKSIILIQNWFRRYICLKRFKDLREQSQVKKYRTHYQRLEQKYTTQKFYQIIDSVRTKIEVPAESTLVMSEQKEQQICDDHTNILKLHDDDKSAIFNTRHIRLRTNTSENDLHSTFTDSKNKSRIIEPRFSRNKYTRNQVLSTSSKQNSILTNKSLIQPQKQKIFQASHQNSRSQIIKVPKKELLVKHQRLIRNAKLNFLQGVFKSGFKYNKDDIDVQDEQGNTPLYYAAENNNLDFVKYLLNLGANPNLLCFDNTPLHIGFKSQNVDIIMEMINHGGNLNILNRQHQTPLIYGGPKLLRSLHLSDGICSVETDEDLKNFDNNKFLTMKKFQERFEADAPLEI